MSSYAIIETGGKQYRVNAGETLVTEVVPNVQVGDTVTFDRVLLVKKEDKIELGTPYLQDTKILATVESLERTKKMIVFKYKPKKRYRRKLGHRQPYMVSRIEEISA